MTTFTPADDAAQLAEYGLAARILLAADAGDRDQVAALLTADPDAAVSALISLAGALAHQAYGDHARHALASVATAADIDAIGREATG